MRHVVRASLIAFGLASATLLAPMLGCGASASQSQANREFDTRGTIREIDAAHLRVTIAHEDVPGYMPAMTMPFELENPDQVSGLGVGNAVDFRFRAAGGGRHVIVAITRR